MSHRGGDRGAIEVEGPRGGHAGVARDNSCVCQVGGVSLCSSERLGRKLANTSIRKSKEKNLLSGIRLLYGMRKLQKYYRNILGKEAKYYCKED